MEQRLSQRGLGPHVGVGRLLLPWAVILGILVLKHRWALSEVDPSLLSRPGRLFIMGTAGSLLCVLPLCGLSSNARGRALTLLGAALANSLLLFASLLSFRQFGQLTSVAMLRYSAQLGAVWDAVGVLVRPLDSLLLVDVVIFGALSFLPRRLVDHTLPKIRVAVGAPVMLVGLGLAMLATQMSPRLIGQAMGGSYIAGEVGLLAFQAHDLVSYLRRLSRRLVYKGPPVHEIQQFLGARRTSRSPMSGLARGKSVIVLQVESLQEFVLDLDVDRQPVAPHLRRLARDSLRFTNFYSQVAQAASADADLLVNCSLFPAQTGAVYFDYADNDFRCLPGVLREHGYRTVAFQGINADFWNLGVVYPRVGFEKYYSERHYDVSERIGMGLSDALFLRQVADRLVAEPRPFYAFLVTLSSHVPYDLPGIPHDLVLTDLEGTRIGHYLHAVHYADAAIGMFVRQLEQAGVLDEAVLVIYGDHSGVTRGNSNAVELLRIPKGDEVAWFVFERRVPLLIRCPGKGCVGSRDVPAGQIDVGPTIASLLGVSSEGTAFFGRDLLGQMDNEVAFISGAVLDKNFAYLPWVRPFSDQCRRVRGGDAGKPGDCVSMVERARRAVALSWAVLDGNLAPAIAGVNSAVAGK